MRLAPCAIFVAGLFWAGSALAADTAPRGPLSFTVLRDGEAVGTHVLSFQSGPDDSLNVSADTNVVVKMAMIPVYRFEHHGREAWKGGYLVALSSDTNDDGTHHSVKASEDGDGLKVNGDGVVTRQPQDILPASLWNSNIVARSSLMNTLDGHAMSVRIADLGGEPVSVAGRTVVARHYAMTGDLSRELWYDGAGVLVQVRFKAKDGSDIQYVLR